MARGELGGEKTRSTWGFAGTLMQRCGNLITHVQPEGETASLDHFPNGLHQEQLIV